MLLRRVQTALAFVLLYSPFKVKAFKLNSQVRKRSSSKVTEFFEGLNKLRHLLNSIAFHKPGPVEDHDYLERAFPILNSKAGEFTIST